MNLSLIAAFLCYFSILLFIGIVSHRRQNTSADFIVGGRSLNFWVTALSAHAADMSSWLFMAFPAAIFMGGLPNAWIGVGLIFGMFMTWQFVAQPLREATERYDSYTLSTFFERRFADQTGLLRLLTSLICVFFLTSYVASGLIGMGWLFESFFGIDYFLGITVALSVAVAYTFYGGFVTVAWTDMFQALFLLVFIVAVPFIAIGHLPHGVADIGAVASAKAISLDFFTKDTAFTALMLVLWGFGYFGQPHILTKFMGLRNPRETFKAKYVGMSWLVITLTSACLIGLVGLAFFPNGLANPELVFIEMVKILFHPFIAGFVLCAVIAATMSTMDSQILVCASVLSEDFYKGSIRKAASSKEVLWVSRIGVILVSIVALLIAYQKNSTVMELVEYAWAGLGCSFGPLLLVSLYSHRVNYCGGIAGIVVGSVVSATWYLVNPYITEMALPAMLPGFTLSLAAIYLFSAIKR